MPRTARRRASTSGEPNAPRSLLELLSAAYALHPGFGEAEAYDREDPAAGLLPSMSLLDGPGFDARRLRPEIRDFYEHTAAWRMEVWTAWSPLFWPAWRDSLICAWIFSRWKITPKS